MSANVTYWRRLPYACRHCGEPAVVALRTEDGALPVVWVGAKYRACGSDSPGAEAMQAAAVPSEHWHLEDADCQNPDADRCRDDR